MYALEDRQRALTVSNPRPAFAPLIIMIGVEDIAVFLGFME